MFLYPSSKKRPFHLGPFPQEVLPRAPVDTIAVASTLTAGPSPAPSIANSPLARVAQHYGELFAASLRGVAAPARAPMPDDLERRTIDAKGAAYFMDAAQVGICQLPKDAWLADVEPEAHSHAVVMLIEHGRVPEPDNLAHEWVAPALQACADMRATQLAAYLAGHFRIMGMHATGHASRWTGIDRSRLAVLAGLALPDGDQLLNPFLGDDYSIAVVTTDYELQCDLPLAAAAARPLSANYWWGINGAQSGRERNRRARRASHLSQYPMETVKRVARPTTLILDDEVPRVPKRAALFERALHGDLGAKSQKERMRFAFKHPISLSQLSLIRALVPHQDGEVAAPQPGAYKSPQENAKAVKSLAYSLGADLAGICEIPQYAWNSHHSDGTAIEPYHRYAIVMLIDQGYDTMEGASGDDWISGAQSMRGYLRGAEVAGVMADLLRKLGFASRSQTNADSDLMHIPLILWAGLGEMSRIGELVLNPFVGPRFKSVVLTTNMPLTPDQPVDFGLQAFCEGCNKCARECPVDAIPHGDKVMFNGYEIWKPDVERCTRYRLTNAKGSACGRCMKTCPLNKVVDADGALLTRTASWLGVNAMWLKPLMVPIAASLDDKLGHGRRNPLKRWWFDHEVVDGVTVAPKGTNERDIQPQRKVDKAAQKVAYIHANAMPAPNDATPHVLDRKAGLRSGDLLESPDEARARHARGELRPTHYVATAPREDAPSSDK